MTTKNFDSLNEAIKTFKNDGYLNDLNLEANCLRCSYTGVNIFLDDFSIDHVCKIGSGEDLQLLYAINSEKNNLKGYLVNNIASFINNKIDPEIEFKLSQALENQ